MRRITQKVDAITHIKREYGKGDIQMKEISIEENGVYMIFEITDKREVKFLHFSSLPFQRDLIHGEEEKTGFRLAEVNLSGLDRPEERHGSKYTVTAPGYRLKYHGHRDFRNECGRKLEIETTDPNTGIFVTSHFQMYDGISLVRSYTTVENKGDEEQCLEYVSSFLINGIEKEGLACRDEKLMLSIPHNSWQRELQWKTYTLAELGLAQSQPDEMQRSSKAVHIGNTGNWSTKEYLPMGYLENKETGTGLFWQIEHNGSWHWEISDQCGHLYLQLSGPTEQESHWYRVLKPGDVFQSVPVCAGVSRDGFDDAIGSLTRYRRLIRRKNKDNETLGIIFNDYMNCLWGDPETEKELPMIEAAADAGCEYYCIDAGWYADGDWWDGVGEWLPSGKRFPGGIKEVLDKIREKGMIPGLWLEPEVMGIHCAKADQVPDDWFFMRHGRRVYDRSRYQLDFRNPQVCEYVDQVIDRLVKEYGAGYIKVDYNIEPGIGTQTDGGGYGDGLLEHERAYLAWLDRVFSRYPELILENCSSGGLRMDYALLSRYSIQSTSDQENYIHYATIAANAPTAVTPEQAAVWSYPLTEGDNEEVIFNMVNTMLLRIHQSGHLVNISSERKALVKEALACYKVIRPIIRTALPFWPIGLSSFSDEWVSLGLKGEGKTLIAVWRREGRNEVCSLPVGHLRGSDVKVTCLYPSRGECAYEWNSGKGTLAVRLPKQISARLFELVTV